MASSSSSGGRVIHPGPEITSLLHMQDKHVSQNIWNGNPDRLLKCRRAQQFHDGGANIPAPIVDLLKESGFYWVAQLMLFQVDQKLITALVERWRPETHTFHMPFGECTITLQDVTILSGLPVDGMALVGNTCSDWPTVVLNMLGSLPPVDAFHGSGLKMTWLNENFSHYPVGYEHNDHVKLIYARAYILRLIGGTMLANHSGSYVPLRYLLLLEDMTEARKYSWGSAVLSLLYRELCCATYYERKEIAGFLPLVQLWAWERFPSIAPQLREDIRVYETAYGTRWVRGQNYARPSHSLQWYRLKFDQFKEKDIVWEPYTPYAMTSLPNICLQNTNNWRSVCPLICYNVVEWHQPDRVMRQFGMRQHIPTSPSQPEELHDLSLKGKFHLDWEQRLHNVIVNWNNRSSYVVINEPQEGPLGRQSDYMMWYLPRTRRWITVLGANEGLMVDGIERINYICSQQGQSSASMDDMIASFGEIKLETDFMLVSMDDVDRISLAFQEAPPATSQPPPVSLEGVVPVTSRERGGLGRRRRREAAVENIQEPPIERPSGMYYAPQQYPYYTSNVPRATYFYPNIPPNMPSPFMSSPQLPSHQLHGYYTPPPYTQPTCTPAAPQHWEHPMQDAPLFSPDIGMGIDLVGDLNNALVDSNSMSQWTSDQLFDEAESSGMGFDLNVNLDDIPVTNAQNNNEDIRRNPHRGARDRHWNCGT